MKILITISLPSISAKDNSPIHVSFCDANSDLSIPLTSTEMVDVWICNGEEVTSRLMNQWLGQTCNVFKSKLVRDVTNIPRPLEYAMGRKVEIAGFPVQEGTATEWEKSILEAASMLHTCTRADIGLHQLDMLEGHDRKSTVLLVEAGIVNLVTAKLLATHGFLVRIINAGPNPQHCKDWTLLGVTSGLLILKQITITRKEARSTKT